MKKIIVLIIMLMVASITIIPTYPSQSIPNHTKITDFDEFLIGDESGLSPQGYFSFEREQGTFEIEGDAEPGGDKYLLVHRGGGNGGEGWLNFYNPKRGYYIDYRPYLPHQSYSHIHYQFYNESGEIVVEFRCYQKRFQTPTRHYFVQYNRLGSWMDLKPVDSVKPLRFSWQHYTDNVIQYKVWVDDGDGGYSLYDTINDTALISGAEYSSPHQFDVTSVRVAQSAGYSGGSGHEIREFGIALDPLQYIPEVDPVGNPFELSTYSITLDDADNLRYLGFLEDQFLETRIETYYTGNITYAGILVRWEPTWIYSWLSHFSLKINGQFVGYADMFYPLYDGWVILWNDLNVYLDNEKPLFEFRCEDEIEIGGKTIHWRGVGVNQAPVAYVTSKKHNSPALWNGVLDGYNQNLDYVVVWGTPEKTTQEYLDDYSDGSEKSFIEFFQKDYECRYTKGAYFKYLAYLNSTEITSDYVSVVIERYVNNGWRSNQLESYSFSIDKSKFDNVVISDLTISQIPYIGLYRMILYDGEPHSESVLHTSIPITVCEEKKTYIDEIEESHEEEIDDIFGISWENMTILIGIALVLVGLVFPNILISEHFLNIKNINLPKEVNIISGIAFLIIAIILGFLPLWIAYIFALAVVAYIVYLVKSMGYGFGGRGGVNGD